MTPSGFEYEDDARRFLDELGERLAKFGVELHPDKTRLIEFGRRAAIDRRQRGLGKPETFDLLGFTHLCARMPAGRFWVRRITINKRRRTKLAEVKDQLRRRRHDPIPVLGTVADPRAARAHGLLLRAGQLRCDIGLALPGHPAVASVATATKPTWTGQLGPDGQLRDSMAS